MYFVSLIIRTKRKKSYITIYIFKQKSIVSNILAPLSNCYTFTNSLATLIANQPTKMILIYLYVNFYIFLFLLYVDIIYYLI